MPRDATSGSRAPVVFTSRPPMTRSRANIRSKAQHGRTQTRAPKQLQLRIIMAEITPPIWRLVRVPDRFTLHQLHRVLQIVFSRLDYHLYAFRMGSRSFEAPDPESEAEDATAIVLNSLGLLPGSQFTYIYDFGDGWEHSIVVEALLPMPSENGPDWSPRLLDGDRAAPPEDAGGPPGYAEAVAALSDPRHPQHKEIRDWVGTTYDPNKFDAWAIDHALALAVAWGAV